MKSLAPSLLVPMMSCAAGFSAPARAPLADIAETKASTTKSAALVTTTNTAAARALQKAEKTRPNEAPFATRCKEDVDCGYDPSTDRCGSDPRFNRQPPIVDQGILCYCDAHREACALFRVLPTPCEGDFSCAVRLDPRPHPTRATKDAPHERGKPCRDYTLATSCERTNICTLRALPCGTR